VKRRFWEVKRRFWEKNYVFGKIFGKVFYYMNNQETGGYYAKEKLQRKMREKNTVKV